MYPRSVWPHKGHQDQTCYDCHVVSVTLRDLPEEVAERLSGFVCYATAPGFRTQLCQITLSLLPRETTFQFELLFPPVPQPVGQLRFLLFCQDHNDKHEQCEFQQADAALDLIQLGPRKADKQYQQWSCTWFETGLLKPKSCGVLNLTWHKVFPGTPSRCLQPRHLQIGFWTDRESWRELCAQPDQGFLDAFRRLFRGQPAYPFVCSDKLEGYFRTHLPDHEREPLPAWFFPHARCHLTESARREDYWTFLVEEWCRSWHWSVHTLFQCQLLDKRHLKLLQRVLTSFVWALPYRSDEVLDAERRRGYRPVEDFSYLRLHPHREWASGDCEDSALEILQAFSEITELQPGPKNWALKLLQRIASQFCACAADALILQYNRTPTPDWLDQAHEKDHQLHMCVLLIPWDHPLLSSYTWLEHSSTQLVADESTRILLCEGTERHGCCQWDEVPASDRETQAWLCDWLQPPTSPADFHLASWETQRMLSTFVPYSYHKEKLTYYRALLRLYAPALFHRELMSKITSLLPIDNQHPDHPGVPFYNFLEATTTDRFRLETAGTLEEDHALYRAFLHFEHFEQPLLPALCPPLIQPGSLLHPREHTLVLYGRRTDFQPETLTQLEHHCQKYFGVRFQGLSLRDWRVEEKITLQQIWLSWVPVT